MSIPPEKRRSNVRLGLILASVALAFMLGYVAKFVVLGP
jgi:hypothetical protein